MKLIISNPATGSCKSIEIDDEKKLRVFYEKRMSQEVQGDALGDEFKGYVFKITGGNDKQGFPMMQGVLVQGRVRLLLRKGHSGYRPRRDGERRRKSVRGCIVGADMSALDLVIIKKGEAELPGITDKYIPRRLGPKRASKIRKLFNLSKEDDVRKYAATYRREIKPRTKNGKTIKRYKMPYIQRLVTPRRIHLKKSQLQDKKERHDKNKRDAADYAKLLKKRLLEARERRASAISKRRESSRRDSTKRESTKGEKAPVKKVEDKKRARPTKEEKPKAAAKGEKAPAKPAAKGAKTAAKPAAAPKAAAPAKPAAKAAAPAKAPAKPAAKAAAPAKPAAAPKAEPKAAASKKPAAKKQKQ